MKIAYCVENIHNSGGIERILSTKSNYLVSHGYQVHMVVICPAPSKPFFYFDPNVKFHYLNLDIRKDHGLRKKINFNKNKKIFLDSLSKLFSEIKPDITISTFCIFSKYIYELKDGSKKILERHFAKYKRAYYYAKLDKYYLGRLITYFYRRQEYAIIQKFDKFVVLTHEDKESWGNRLSNIEVIENALTCIPKSTSELENKKVITLGRLNQQKQLDHLIEIWSVIAKKYPDWKLEIYGSGSQERKLKQLISKLKLTGFIKILPATPNIEKVFLESSIYAMTSKYEGFGLALAEAMSYGVPPVSYACKCGPRDIINNNKDGYLVAFNDKKEFIEKLSLLIEDENKRKEMGKAASTNILRYSPEAIMKKWMNLFDKLVNTN
ncbi:glycosyltransferase family 4 protein [Apibacter muscae]|uniref:glycosyltransferase family 4 protein n=1 Tax=Apibacter muscae TaxID=2509004 RepID=UPI0011ABD77F|nr:glycosyltransferase family 4 protein [Apibacter muscae]TWP24325.1 glycosyltransferase family 4 protein [Apibacter muscae]TWP30113.1 glycosyltransferase family 4 protein [Apibacter muscae]